jgi:4-hydroxy-3-methylbut-2-enyl diphosphate reductase
MSGSAQARTVLLASPRSFCAGVERAIAVIENLLDQRGGPIYVRKQIVHNVHVVADLQARGAVFVDELDAVPEGATTRSHTLLDEAAQRDWSNPTD